MTKFLTISPTHIPGKKRHAWQRFLEGEYVAIGWFEDVNLSNKSLDEIKDLIRDREYPNEKSAIDSFDKFLSLNLGDYVAINNTNDGLFGIGKINSGYKYEHGKHDVGSGDTSDNYSHYREVKWEVTHYLKRKDLIQPGETGWSPYGTVGALLNSLPPYIERALGIRIPTQETAPEYVRPDRLKEVISAIKNLIKDPNHQERDHEALVQGFLSSLGYDRLKDIRFRRGRIDVSIWKDQKQLLVIEVKRDWNLNVTRNQEAVRQAYGYALENGVRFVMVSNGNYYAIFDRLRGLSYEDNLIGEFTLTALEESDLELIKLIEPNTLISPNFRDTILAIAENFKGSSY